MDIKYSIIIPHYNIPHLLKRCCMSIPEREDIQIIVVDDKSPNANSYLKEYSFLNRSNLEFHICKENGGGGHARNEGLKYATGKWLLFADSDDFFVEGFDVILDEYYESDADIIYFNIQSVYSDDISKPADRNVVKDNLFAAYKKTNDSTPFRYSYCEPWGKLIKREMVEKNGIVFDETRVANDYYFSVATGCIADMIKVVDKRIYVLTYRDNSVSAKFGDTKEKILTRLEVYTRVQLLMEKYGYDVKPMRIRGLMVLLMKHHFVAFLKQLIVIHSKGISVRALISQIFDRQFMN